MTTLTQEAKDLLKRLIQTPSLSKQEEGTARLIADYIKSKNIPYERKGNNVWASNLFFDSSLPTILLNSHHDTVPPNSSYTLDPFIPTEREGKLYGLGSNDAGASLVGLLAGFLYFYDKKLNYNLIYAATAEEEISGENGIGSILPGLGVLSFAIVGEPTEMQLAIAEKGLVVLHCRAKGRASHAAHPNENHAIYKAIEDIKKVEHYTFDRISEVLGKVKATVTVIQAGSLHNVVPDHCDFTIDVRTNEHYSNQEILDTFDALLDSEVSPKSLRLNSSKISLDHPIVLAAKRENCRLYGSPTISDQALIPFDSVKIGIGDSLRSHTADEFVYLRELEEGISKYIRILSRVLLDNE
ncbi:MAG: M20/M25/M40 family metallo-hydrolase [Bergeyella sp.]|nr:M20/M25/M40 family metallo-hydrolase [Bergeyella sp.]